MFMKTTDKIRSSNQTSVMYFFVVVQPLFKREKKSNKDKWPSATHTSCWCRQNAFLMGFELYFEKTVVHLCQDGQTWLWQNNCNELQLLFQWVKTWKCGFGKKMMDNCGCFVYIASLWRNSVPQGWWEHLIAFVMDAKCLILMMDDPLFIPLADSMQSWVKAVHCRQTRKI